MDRRLLALLAPYRWRVVGAVACAAIAAVGMASYAFLAGPALRALVHGDSLDVGPMLGKALPVALAERLASGVIGTLPLLLIAAGAAKAASSAGFNILLPGAVAAAAADLRRLLHRRLVRADPEFFRKRPTGDLVSRFTGDVAWAESSASQVVVTLVRDVSQAVALVAACALLDLRLMVAAVVVVPGTLLPVRRFANALRGIGREQLAAQGQISKRVQQVLAGHAVVQAQGGEDHERARLARANEGLIEVMRRSLLWRAAFTPVMELLGVFGLAFAIGWAGRAVAEGSLPPEAVISFAAAALMLFQPLKALGNLGQQLAQLRAAADRAFEILDAPDAIADAPGAVALPPPAVVRLEGVTVRYGERVALQGVDLTFRAGETVALVGESGAGKSTVASLLLRFIDPTEGRVTFD
ncbi:MAG TPA: ABC transporter ATP-binding protein, partial [Vulgatibacter sp.]|nr:ABC transporter ATP-binding protein [Vulgatibacter sp.]